MKDKKTQRPLFEKRGRRRASKLRPPKPGQSLGGMLLDGIFGAALAYWFTEEIRRLWAALDAGEPVRHVLIYQTKEALLYAEKNPGMGSAALMLLVIRLGR